MKKAKTATAVVLAFFAMLLMTTTSCGKRNIPPERIDNAAATFIQTHFPDVTVLSIVKEGSEYEVCLSDYTKIEFGRGMKWKEVNCAHANYYTEVPAALVPEEIFNYMQQHHLGRLIVKISRTYKEWEIELDNQLEITFDKDFNVIEID